MSRDLRCRFLRARRSPIRGRQLLALSPDGANLVYVANNRRYLRPLSGLEARAIAGTEIPTGILQPVFSPDGQSLVFHCGR